MNHRVGAEGFQLDALCVFARIKDIGADSADIIGRADKHPACRGALRLDDVIVDGVFAHTAGLVIDHIRLKRHGVVDVPFLILIDDVMLSAVFAVPDGIVLVGRRTVVKRNRGKAVFTL